MRIQSAGADPRSMALENFVIPSDTLSHLSTERYFRHDGVTVVTLSCLLSQTCLEPQYTKRRRGSSGDEETDKGHLLSQVSLSCSIHTLEGRFLWLNVFACFVPWSFWDTVSYCSSRWKRNWLWSSVWPWTCSNLPGSAWGWKVQLWATTLASLCNLTEKVVC